MQYLSKMSHFLTFLLPTFHILLPNIHSRCKQAENSLQSRSSENGNTAVWHKWIEIAVILMETGDLVWFGTVWYCLVWFGLLWFGMVW